jgi:mycofactocin precursor
MNGPTSLLPDAEREPASEHTPVESEGDLLLVEEISIDGMCGVY